MQNKHTLLLIICALLLGVNIGMLLSRDGSANLNLLPNAVAAAPTVSPNGGSIFTCSEDGAKLYMWSPKNVDQNKLLPLVAVEYTR